ncbi:MAG: cysteine--tRNA ligase [Bacteriovoracaceae bacterium]
MALTVYNTMSGKKEKFVPLEEGKVKLYLCGPTVYDYLHIGNFRGPITFNLMRNWMERSGLKVEMAYNYTDVDDKILEKAKQEGVEPKEISEKFIKEFEKDFKALGLRPHDHNPKVTEHIPQIIQSVQTLIDNGNAYEIDGEIYYSIDSFKDYGKLSKKKLDELEDGARVQVDSRKKNPHDFALWKASKEGEAAAWESPWGKGRPGWHIECSAMIHAIFGSTIDIHGGGIDLIFPHHENEIAQGEGHTGCKYCNYWIHNNFINMNNEKMSKSLGNIMTARSFLENYHAEILKYLFLSAHYRTVFSVSEDRILQVIGALNRIYSSLELAQETVERVEGEGQPDAGFKKKLEGFDAKIKRALNDDFNSAEFISLVFEAVRAFNALGFGNKKKRNTIHKASSQLFIDWMKSYGDMSALFNEEPRKMLDVLDDISVRLKNIDREKVEALVAKRNEARDQKDWERADTIRDELSAMGVELIDGAARGWRVSLHD